MSVVRSLPNRSPVGEPFFKPLTIYSYLLILLFGPLFETVTNLLPYFGKTPCKPIFGSGGTVMAVTNMRVVIVYLLGRHRRA